MSNRETTGGFSSQLLLEEEKHLVLPSFIAADAMEIGEIAKSIGIQRGLPIAVEVRIGDWIIYHASLPGSTS